MAQVTVQLSDELADRCKTIGPWLSAIIELSLAGFKTPAAASEVIELFFTNPAPDELAAFHVSEEAQLRLQRLLALNQAGFLSLSEQDELQQFEHLLVMLKIAAVKQAETLAHP